MIQLRKGLRHNHENVIVLTAVMETSLIITTTKAVFCISIQYIHLTKLSCVGFCSSCTFDYFTEYFMLSRYDSVCFTFHVMTKITYAYHAYVWLKNKMCIIRMNRTMIVTLIRIRELVADPQCSSRWWCPWYGVCRCKTGPVVFRRLLSNGSHISSAGCWWNY